MGEEGRQEGERWAGGGLCPRNESHRAEFCSLLPTGGVSAGEEVDTETFVL